MDHWHPISVRAEKLDVVQRWAQLEAKSPAMREELCERYARQPAKRQSRIPVVSFLVLNGFL
jgi:hypothetical protein